MVDKMTRYIDSKQDELLKDLFALRNMPEVGFEEVKTSAFLAERMEQLGYSVKTGVAKTGVVATADSGKPGPCVGIRGDMDALLHEIGGEVKAVHSCGHDANCTAALYAADALMHAGIPVAGKLKIVFQPAEEKLFGAKEMIASGEIDDIQFFIASHLRPPVEVAFGKVSPSIRHGASAIMRVLLTGVQAHAARPHLGVNVAEACAAVIFAVNGIRINPSIPHSAKATMIKCGGASYNVIPDKAEMVFDIRAQTNEQMEAYRQALTETVSRSAGANGAVGEVLWKAGGVAASDNEAVVRIAERSIAQALGEGAVAPCVATSGGEDFHEYAYHDKNLKATLLGIGSGMQPGFHHPEMTYNELAAVNGAKVLAATAFNLFNDEQN